MEDNRVPSFVQYPQKRKRTVSNNVTSSPKRASKRHEPASLLVQSGTSLVDETKDAMECFTNVNEEVVDTAVSLAKEKMDIEETEVMAIPTATTVVARDEVKEINEKREEKVVQNRTPSSRRIEENSTTIVEQKFKDEENKQSIDPALIFLNTATKTTIITTTTTTNDDEKNDGFIQKTTSKDQQQSADKSSSSSDVEKEQLTSPQSLASMATTTKTTESSNTIITPTNDITEELSANKDTAITTATTLIAHAIEEQDGSTKRAIQESKNTTDIQKTQDEAHDDTQAADNDDDIIMESNDEDTEVVAVSIQKEKDNKGNVKPDIEEDNDQGLSETSTAVDEPSPSQQKVIKDQQTPWLSSIWTTLISPFRSKK